MSEPIVERGPWEVLTGYEGEAHKPTVFIHSDDFTHDVMLRVFGDFESHEQKLAYGQEIARRLNEWWREHGDET